jgi:hypothetical protein
VHAKQWDEGTHVFVFPLEMFKLQRPPMLHPVLIKSIPGDLYLSKDKGALLFYMTCTEGTRWKVHYFVLYLFVILGASLDAFSSEFCSSCFVYFMFLHLINELLKLYF